MSYRKVTDRSSVIAAIRECDEIGRKGFLEKYGFAPAREYFLKFEGKTYDSKAIIGVAHKYQFPNFGVLNPSEFGGGDKTVRPQLEGLGFEIEYIPSNGKFVIITENDESQWSDKTGVLYHFPSRYQGLIPSGTKAVYYKGKIKDGSYSQKRLSDDPHYFGIATIGKSTTDLKSDKGDYFCEILDFQPFSKPVYFKRPDGSYLEPIPSGRESNYWRYGVRAIDESTYYEIVSLSDIDMNGESDLNDLSQGLESAFESRSEGGKTSAYTTRYERDGKIRQQVLLLHGYRCQNCSIDFSEKYGSHGKGFIHVHHLIPLAEIDQVHSPNPKTDFAVLCPNCHAMVHRRKINTLSLAQLVKLTKK